MRMMKNYSLLKYLGGSKGILAEKSFIWGAEAGTSPVYR